MVHRFTHIYTTSNKTWQKFYECVIVPDPLYLSILLSASPLFSTFFFVEPISNFNFYLTSNIHLSTSYNFYLVLILANKTYSLNWSELNNFSMQLQYYAFLLFFSLPLIVAHKRLLPSSSKLFFSSGGRVKVDFIKDDKRF